MRSNLARSVTIACLACVALPAATIGAQTSASGLMEEAAPPGANYDKAEFRFWSPQTPASLRAVLVLVPGSNGDGRPRPRTRCGRRLRRRTSSRSSPAGSPTSRTIRVSSRSTRTSRRAAARRCSTRSRSSRSRSKHPEIANAPLLLWGMSAGGEFNYEFAVWKPERVAAFIVNKGNFYYTALVPARRATCRACCSSAARISSSGRTPSWDCSRVNRRGGALWALAEEPGVGHVVGKSRDVAMVFFEDVLPLRLAGDRAGLTPLNRSLASSATSRRSRISRPARQRRRIRPRGS